jgi:NADPH:quinone reductase-like Zn-dependent oxidoreductase
MSRDDDLPGAPRDAVRRELLRAVSVAALAGAAAPRGEGASGSGAGAAPRLGRAWELPPPYGAGSLRQVRVPVPAPGRGEVLVRVRATGINARDLTIIKGSFRQKPVPPGFVPLSDNAGDVVAVGEGVAGVAPGDRVLCIHYPTWEDGRWHISRADLDLGASAPGFLRDYATVPATGLVRLPSTLTYREACTLPVAGVTAWRALREIANLAPGETMLTLGTGGVSVFGLQVAKMLGARVAITSSSDDKLARMRELGADFTVNYRSNPRWGLEVLERTGGVDVVMDNAGPSSLDQTLAACASAARVVFIGMVGGFAQTAALPQMMMRGLGITSMSNASRRSMQDFVRAIDANGLKPLVGRVFGFDEAPEAFRYFGESADRIGNIVIEVA